jgi:hypothetical protein
VADAPQWPDSLPQDPFIPGDSTPEYDPADNTIRTSVTAGPAKLRRRFTAVPETTKIKLWLTSDQCATLKDFVENQVSDVLPFTWRDFRDDSQCLYRFTKGRGSITYKHDSGDIWIVEIELEKLP